MTACVSFEETSGFGDAAGDVWRTVWSALDDFVTDLRGLLGSHLRSGAIELRATPEERGSQRGVLSIGSTHLHLDCPRRCVPPSKAEVAIARAFGAVRPLARVFVLRKIAADAGGWHVESTLIADPASRVWIATEPELGPAPLGDVASLERFFWYLVLDKHA